MGLNILTLQQGSPEWLAHRDACLNASDAPVMKGVSKYQTRSELVRQKATGISKEHDAGTLARFQVGHDAEASIRPHAEFIVGESLYPVTGENVIDGLRLSASSDGLTMDGEVGFEHKSFNKSLAESVRRGIVPDSHIWQIVHQHAVFGLKRTLFMVSDGTDQKCEFCWVEVTQEQINELLSNWKLFNEDVKNFVHVEAEPKVVTGPVETLPAIFVTVEGRITNSNLPAFVQAAHEYIDRIQTDLVTDADFETAAKNVNELESGEKRLEAVKANALAQTSSIDELFRAIDQIKGEMKKKRLHLADLVKTKKENRKIQIVTEAKQALVNHVMQLNQRIGGAWMPAFNDAPFAEAIKGLKSIDSMREKVGNALRDAKIEASAIADNIEANRKLADDMTLVPDFGQVCTKQPDDFAAMYAMRKQKRDEADAAKLEADRARIRAEEQAKAEREAQAKAQVEADRIRAEERAKAQAEQDARDAETARQRLIEHQRQAEERAAYAAQIKASAEKSIAEANARDALQHGFGPADNTPPMKLGEICARLGFTITADFLAQLGFQPVGTERAAKLYAASSFPQICQALIAHIQAAERSVRMAA
jgi:predicted phage-related endonuclease